MEKHAAEDRPNATEERPMKRPRVGEAGPQAGQADATVPPTTVEGELDGEEEEEEDDFTWGKPAEATKASDLYLDTVRSLSACMVLRDPHSE